MADDLSTNDIYDLFVVSETCLVHHLLMVLKSDTVQGFFVAILGRGRKAFQIGKISAVNHLIGKFSKQTITAFSVNLKTN